MPSCCTLRRDPPRACASCCAKCCGAIVVLPAAPAARGRLVKSRIQHDGAAPNRGSTPPAAVRGNGAPARAPTAPRCDRTRSDSPDPSSVPRSTYLVLLIPHACGFALRCPRGRYSRLERLCALIECRRASSLESAGATSRNAVPLQRTRPAHTDNGCEKRSPTAVDGLGYRPPIDASRRASGYGPVTLQERLRVRMLGRLYSSFAGATSITLPR